MYGSYPVPSHGDERRAGCDSGSRRGEKSGSAPGRALLGRRRRAQSGGDVHEARNVVDGPEVVDMRQDRAHAAGLGLKPS